MEYELCIREAEVQDATDLIAFLNLVSKETDFTSLDKEGIMMSESEMVLFIEKQASSENQITLLALLNDTIAGVLNITADPRLRVRHIGDIFLVVQKNFGIKAWPVFFWRKVSSGLNQVVFYVVCN